MREVIVGVLTIIIVGALGFGLNALSKTMDFWPFMALGGTLIGLMLLYGYSVDRAEKKKALEEGIILVYRRGEPLFGPRAKGCLLYPAIVITALITGIYIYNH